MEKPPNASAWPKRPLLALALAALLGALACKCPDRENAWQPQEGDILFQSSPHSDLVDAIEGVTGSAYSHCGVVARRSGSWVVIEAIGPVQETALAEFIGRGRGGRVSAYRLRSGYESRIPNLIAALRSYLGRPYDPRYRMDDERIYCSELVYKAFLGVYGERLGQLQSLGSLNWRPYTATIEKYEGGPVALAREVITPRALSEAAQLARVK